MKSFFSKIMRQSSSSSSPPSSANTQSNPSSQKAKPSSESSSLPKSGTSGTGSFLRKKSPRSMVAFFTNPERERAISKEELDCNINLAEDVLPGLLVEAISKEGGDDLDGIVQILGGHLRIHEGASESRVVTLQKTNTPREGLCFETLDVLEQIACCVEGGADACGAVGLPSQLLTCLGLFYGIRVNEKRDGITVTSTTYTDFEEIDNELTASENDDESGSESNVKSGKISRTVAVFQRVSATLCHLLSHVAVLLSLIRDPDFGLETLFFLVQGTRGRSETCIPLLEAMTKGSILPAVLEHVKERGMLKRLLASMQGKENMTASCLPVISGVGKLLQASSRTSQVLLEEFQAQGGYAFLYEILLLLPDHTERLLTEIRQLVYVGKGFAQAEEEAEHLGVVHSVFLARNEAAFAVVAGLLCHLQYQMCDEDETVKAVVLKHHKFAWSYMSSEAFCNSYTPVSNADTLRLPLLHCVLTIYSSNPVNFGLLDEKFGVMSTLLVSLGSSLSVHDEFLFMIAKLLELISMGMDYRPRALLETICRTTLPALFRNRDVSATRRRRQHTTLSFDLGAPDELSPVNPSEVEHRAAGLFVMRVLCKTLVKMVHSDEDYKDILRECGLLKDALFPFVEQGVKTTPADDPELFKMLPIWCALLCDMLEGNVANERSLRDANLHSALYTLIPVDPKAVLGVIQQLSRRDDNPYLEQDVSALLELVQKDRNQRTLKIEMLSTLTEMMHKNHSLKDVLRRLGGFESLLAILLSLESSFDREDRNIAKSAEDEKREDETVALMEKVFETFTIAMTGNQLVNRAYMKEEIRYESLSSTCQLIGIFGVPQDAHLVDMVLDCATEAIAVVHSSNKFKVVDKHTLRIRNVDPLQVLTIRVSVLSMDGLTRLLNRLRDMVNGNHSEQAANCEILCQTLIPKLIMEELFDSVLCDPSHVLHDTCATLLGSLARHHSTTKSTQQLLEMTFELYRKRQAMGDGDTSGLKGVLQMLNLAANPGNDDAFFCPYVQMAGPSDVFVLAHPQSTNNPPSILSARKIPNQPSHRSLVQNNAPGNIHVASLGKRTWPPANGYTLSMWVWLGEDVEEEILLASLRTADGFQLLRVTLESGNIIRIRNGGTSFGLNTSSASSSSSSTPGSHEGLANIALAAVMSAAEASASLGNRIKVSMNKRRTMSSASSSPTSAKERFLNELMPYDISFPDVNLSTGRWHHLVLVQRCNANMNIGIMLDKSLGGKITLYCDGVEVATAQKFPYPTPTPNAGLRTSVYVGVDPIVSATRRTGDGVRFWRLGPFHLLDVPKDEKFARSMYLLGVNYTGALTRTCATLRDARTFTTVLLERLYTYEKDHSIVQQLESIGLPHTCWKKLLHSSSTFLNQHGSVDLESVVFSFFAGRRTTLDGFPSIDTKSLIEKNIREIDVPRTVLINGADLVTGQQPILGVLGGGAFAVTPLPLCDSIRSVGGVPVVLRLLELTHEPSLVVMVLELLRNLLSGHEYNRFTFRQSNGHRVLAWLMFGIAQHARNIFTPQVFETMLNLAVLGTGRAALIVDPEMLHQLILNHQVWRGGEKTSSYSRWRFVIIIVQWLSNLVDEDNVNVSLNLDALHRLNIIDWVLEIMLSLAVDIPPEEGIISDILAAALQFLHNLNKQSLVRRSVYELFKHILVSLPIHSEDTNPTASPAMGGETGAVDLPIPPTINVSTVDARSESPPMVEEDTTSERSLSPPRIPSAVSSPRGARSDDEGEIEKGSKRYDAKRKRGRRRRTVTDLMMMSSGKRVQNSNRVPQLPSEEHLVSEKGEAILKKVRCMLFQLLMDLPETPPVGVSGEKHRQMIYSAYSDILSVHWFTCLLAPGLDNDTVLLALRLLVEVVQQSSDFAGHFISAGGLSMVSQRAAFHRELPSILFTLMLLLYGIPPKVLGPPIIFTPKELSTGGNAGSTFSTGGREPLRPDSSPRGSGLTRDGRISSFVSPEVKKRLLSRKSTVESSSSVQKVNSSVVSKFEKIAVDVFSIRPPPFAVDVLGVIFDLLKGLIPVASLRSSSEWVSGDDAMLYSNVANWDKEKAQELCVDVTKLFETTIQSFPEALGLFMGKRSLELFCSVIFQEASALDENEEKDTDDNTEGCSMFTGSLSQSLLNFFVELLSSAVAENSSFPSSVEHQPPNQPGTPKNRFTVKSARKLLETIMQSFPNSATPRQVLWFQTALVQAFLPRLSLMLDDKTWAARRSSGSMMSLPYNADPSKLVACICFMTGRASFGFVPQTEHTILELIGQAKTVIDSEEQKQRILRCIRGLVLWTIETALLNNTVEDDVQFLRAVLRNYDILEVARFCSSLVPTNKKDPTKRDTSVTPARDPYVPVETLPEPLRSNVDMYDETLLFVFCLIHLILQELRVSLEMDYEVSDNVNNGFDLNQDEADQEKRRIKKQSSRRNLDEVQVCLVELLRVVVQSKKDLLLNHTKPHIRSGFKLLLDEDKSSEFVGWLTKEYFPLPSEWLGDLWVQVQRIELFGSPMQCGLTNAYNLKKSLMNAEQENYVASGGSPRQTLQNTKALEAEIKKRLQGKRKLLYLEVDYMKKYRRQRSTQTSTDYEKAFVQVASESKELMDSTQKDAVDRHRRWQRVGLEHLLRGKRFWQGITNNFRCGINHKYFDDFEFGDEMDPTKSRLHWMLDCSEGKDRMRRRIVAHLDFSKTFRFVSYVPVSDPDESLKLFRSNSRGSSSEKPGGRDGLEDQMNRVFSSIVRKPDRLRSNTDVEDNFEMDTFDDAGGGDSILKKNSCSSGASHRKTKSLNLDHIRRSVLLEEGETDDVDDSSFSESSIGGDSDGDTDDDVEKIGVNNSPRGYDTFALMHTTGLERRDSSSMKISVPPDDATEDSETPTTPATASTSASTTTTSMATTSSPSIAIPPISAAAVTITNPRSKEEDERVVQMTIEDEIAELGWETAERILTELEYGDRKPEKIFNCGEVSGMETIQGIGLVCESALYFVSNYEIKENGTVEELNTDTSVSHSFDVTVSSDEKGSDDTEEDELLQIVPKTSFDSPSGFQCLTPRSVRSGDGANFIPPVTHDFVKVRYDNIREVYRRRYMLCETGLEVFAVDGFNFLLVFLNAKDRDWVFTRVLSKELPSLVISKSADMQGLAQSSLTNPEGLTLGLGALMAPWRRFRASVTKKWKDGEISNFGYLMYLNTLAGRSHNDLTQYPVFPWILKQYTEDTIDLEDPDSYRDLSKPMGALNAERAKQFTERYASLASVAADTNLQPFHYGTHYSCSAYVLQFLIRLEPYTRLALELQSGQFDRADRLFHSFRQSWRSVSGDDFNAQDVRELIPEFFYLPEFLQNKNGFDLGITQRGKRVGDVELPAWAKGDPYHFVRIHRRALESRYVSEHLHEWIDLIFGYKQRGRAAIEAQNVFHPLTYEGEVNIDEIDDPLMKKATMAQIHNFGQTPRKLFSKPHPRRTVPPLSSKQPFSSGDVNAVQWHSRLAPPLVIPGSFNRPNISHPGKQVSEKLPGQVHLIKVDSASFRFAGFPGAVKEMTIHGDKVLAVWGSSSIVHPSHTHYLSWGSENGSLLLHQITSSALNYGGSGDKIVGVFESLHHGPITACAVTKDGKQIWTAGSDAIVAVWRLRKQKGKNVSWALDQVECLASHKSKVTSLALCQVQGIAVSGSKDCTAVLWDLEKKRFIRQLGRQKSSILEVSINSANGNILTLSGCDLSYWHINGNLIAHIHLSPVVNDLRLEQPRCCLATDCDDYQDGIVCATGHSAGAVALWDLPEGPGQRKFMLRTVIQTDSKASVTSLALDKGQRRLSFGDANGRCHLFASVETSAPMIKATEFFSNIGRN